MIRSAFRALGAVLPLVLVATAGAQEEGLPPLANRDAAAAPKTPTADGFLGPRPLLKNLSAADQALLASLILEYATANNNAVVKVHENTMMDPALHGVHQAPYTLLFSWHRTYLAGLETFLTSKGQGKFVPLPKWMPSDPIPLVFGEDAKKKKLIKNFNPNQDWTQFFHSKLSVFKEEIRQGASDTTANNLILADTLVVPHNNTHNIIGGTMSTMGSPAVPIFWCYHAFIDDIAWDYEHLPPPPKAAGLASAEEPKGGVTTIRGEVMKDDKGNVMIMSPAGNFNVVNEPFKSILADMAGKPVAVQATLNGNDATVVSITAHASADLNVRDDHGKLIGTRSNMEEVRITGVLGGKLKIDQPDGSGFVVKTGVNLVDASMKTAGMTGGMHMDHD
jgi:hypothetical protein